MVTQSEIVSSASISGAGLREWLRRWHWGVALLAYTFLSLAVTFPLIFRLGDSSAGPASDGDNLWFAWLLWAYRNAVLSGQDPNRTHWIFALLPSVQVLADAHFNLLVGIPLLSITSPLTAYNLLVLISFILSGLTMYLLAQEFVADRFACFAAGFLYTFSTYHFARAAGHFGLMTLQWLPFCAWRLFALYRRPSWMNAVLAGVSIALVPFSDLYYLPYFLVPFGLLLVAGVLVANRAWFAKARNLGLCAVALVVAIAVAGPVLGGFLSVDADERTVMQAESQLSALEPLAADLVAFVVPSAANPFVGAQTQAIYSQVKTLYAPIETSSFLGYPVLLLAFCGLIFWRRRTRTVWFWLALGVGGLVLALGPALFIEGHRIVSLPMYAWLFRWPFLSNYRAPNRLTVLPLLAFSLLSAYGIAALRDRWGNGRRIIALRGIIVILLGIAVAQQVLWSFPYPVAPVHISPLYQEIGNDSEDGLLLDLPLLPSGAYQYDQSIHHKRLVNGYTPRMTPAMIASVYNLPYLSQFTLTSDGARLNIVGDHVAVSPEGSFKDVMQQNGIKYIVMHRNVEPVSFAKMRGFLIDQLGVPFYDNATEGLTAWKVAPASPASAGTNHVTFGTGWLPGVGERDGMPERYADQDAQLGVNLPSAKSATISFFATPILKPMTIEVRVNGRAVKSVPFTTVGVAQGVHIEQVPLKAGENTIELHSVEGCVRPSDISTSPDTRCFTVGVQQFAVTTG